MFEFCQDLSCGALPVDFPVRSTLAPMARRTPRRPSSGGPLTSSACPELPTGPVPTDSGEVELIIDRDDPRALTVMVNGVPSSFIDLDDPRNVMFEYMEIMATVLDQLPAGPLDVVHLGAAGCAMARLIDATRPGSRQIGIDIDARLLELARAWFDLPRAPRLRLRAGDAREQLASLRTASADIVIRDVFAGDITPPHLLTAEFVSDVLRVLRPGGLYLVNCVGKPPLTTARSEVATLLAALQSRRETSPDGPLQDGQVALATEPGVLKCRRNGNVVLILQAPSTPNPAGLPLLAEPHLARMLRSLATPSHLVCEPPEVARFAGHSPVLKDAQSTSGGGPNSTETDQDSPAAL